MSGWQSLAEWWDTGPKPQAKDREDVASERHFGKPILDGTTQMEKWKTPGFDGGQTVEHAKQVVRRVSGAEYERLKREGEAAFKQHPEIGRER